MTTFRKSLRRRFLVSFASLMGGLALLGLLLTMGSLLLYYRSTVDMRTREVGRRFDDALGEAQDALLFRTRILAEVARMQAMGLDAKIVREIQVYTLQSVVHSGASRWSSCRFLKTILLCCWRPRLVRGRTESLK
jgi:hypothetical protein